MSGGVNSTGVLDSIEIYSISEDRWRLLTFKLPHKIQDLSMECVTQNEFMVFGGQNPEIEGQFIYKIEISNKNSYLISQLQNGQNDKSFLLKDKIFIFGVT